MKCSKGLLSCNSCVYWRKDGTHSGAATVAQCPREWGAKTIVSGDLQSQSYFHHNTEVLFAFFTLIFL